MTSFARTVSRVNRLIDALLSQILAADQWPLVDGHLQNLVAALAARDRNQTDEVCVRLERQFCASPFILRTFESETSWFARVPAPRSTLDLAAQARAADF